MPKLLHRLTSVSDVPSLHCLCCGRASSATAEVKSQGRSEREGGGIISLHERGVEVSSPRMNSKTGWHFHSTLKCIYQIRSQLLECGEWPERLAFLWGGRTHKRRPIILCWNKSATDTAVKKEEVEEEEGEEKDQ